ncbi:MAG: hypothetical protein V1676_02895 [Candidatus Diapherotrites archaeon]
MQAFYQLFAKASFFFALGVVLASLFIWCLLQGGLAQFSGDSTLAFTYYFIGCLSGIAAFALYLQAKTLFYYAKISNI